MLPTKHTCYNLHDYLTSRTPKCYPLHLLVHYWNQTKPTDKEERESEERERLQVLETPFWNSVSIPFNYLYIYCTLLTSVLYFVSIWLLWGQVKKLSFLFSSISYSDSWKLKRVLVSFLLDRKKGWIFMLGVFWSGSFWSFEEELDNNSCMFRYMMLSSSFSAWISHFLACMGYVFRFLQISFLFLDCCWFSESLCCFVYNFAEFLGC